jgi:polysaccharide export outer membrane protein
MFHYNIIRLICLDMKIGVFFLISIFLFMTSCITQKKMLLLQSGTDAISDTLQLRLYQQYRLQSGDIVDIKVSSLDPNSVAVFNKAVGVTVTSAVNEASLYVNGYMIDQFGTVNLPLIGDLEVKGLTIDSLNSLLDMKLGTYFKFYTVESKLVNFRVSVLGEVKRPGTQQVYNSDLTVLQALANANGVSDYGDRRKVKIIRKAFNHNESFLLDLSKEEVIYSEYFYLMPNDVIYVEPLKSKATALNVPLFALLISSLSLAILVINSFSK